METKNQKRNNQKNLHRDLIILILCSVILILAYSLRERGQKKVHETDTQEEINLKYKENSKSEIKPEGNNNYDSITKKAADPDAGKKLSQDGAIQEKPSIKQVNVKDFGAKGDGVTNDTASFQKAVDYASKLSHKEVVVPKGVYCVRMVKLRSGMTLSGVGKDSILKTHVSSKVWEANVHLLGVSNIVIKNITFDGNKPLVPGSGNSGILNLDVENSTDIIIYNCRFQNNWCVNVCLKNCNKVTVKNSKFINSDCGVITLQKPSSNLTIIDNYFDGADMSEPISIFGLRAGYHFNITIVGNVIKNHTKGQGILIRAAKSVVVKNNTIDNCTSGIYLCTEVYDGTEYGVYDTVIQGNRIINSKYEGISLHGARKCKVNSNEIINVGTFGFYVSKSKYCEIIDNTIKDANAIKSTGGIFGMVLRGVKNSVISDNDFIVTREDIKYKAHCLLSSQDGEDCENNSFLNNKFFPDSITTYQENPGGRGNIFISNNVNN